MLFFLKDLREKNTSWWSFFVHLAASTAQNIIKLQNVLFADVQSITPGLFWIYLIGINWMYIL